MKFLSAHKKNSENARFLVESCQMTFYTHVLKVYINFRCKKKTFKKIIKFAGTIPLILWKESLNSDGQQFHQYQQNEHGHLTSTHWSLKKTTTYDIINLGPGLGQAQTMAL